MVDFRRVLFLFLLSNCVLFLTAQNTRKMSIDEMFEIADLCSRSMRTYRIAEEEAEQAVRIAKDAKLPAIELSVSASFLGDAWLSDRDFSNGQNAPMPHFGNNLALKASQIIYAGGAISNKTAVSKLQYQLAQLDK